ncbi:MAG: hypothetical protein VX834_04205 [Myxococcota bacterium]|nr:hypothetical protein [Myxococcota bacterium]
MSTRGVERMMRDVVRFAMENNNGEVTAEEFEKVVNYARNNRSDDRWFTSGERRALVQPGSYLERAGFDLDAIRFEPGAIALAESIAKGADLELFPQLKNARTTAAQPTPDAPTNESSLRDRFNDSMAKGKDLGSFENWKVDTAGATVKFATDSAGRTWPGLVLDTREFKDPSPRDLVGDNRAALEGVKTLEEFKTVVDDILAKETGYFAAEGVDTKSVNEGYGIRNLRRQAFISKLKKDGVKLTGLSSSDQVKARGIAEGASIQLVSGVDFEMKVGSHTNYWPYWDNYAPPLEKMLEQTTEGSDEYFQIKNRLNDIYRRKTSRDSYGRKVDDRNFEQSVKMALVYNPQFTVGVGHRVSLTDDSTTFAPKYELLSVKADGLPEDLKKYAGMQLMRDSDTDKTVRFDYMGEGDSETAKLAKSMAGQAIPAELKDFITAKALSESDLESLTMRDFESGEKARSSISMDWSGNGAINVAKTHIGWWGHCHNEAPLNAMDVDPNKDVRLYRANRGVDSEKALKTYSSDDAWDIAGAFVSDHEGRPEWAVASTGRATYSVDDTSFVGSRNDGGHNLNITLSDGRSLTFDGEIMSLTAEDGTSKNPKSIFRDNVENEDGSFAKNPSHLSTVKGDEVTVDVTKHTMRLDVEYFTFDSSGYPMKKETSVSLDPTKDEFVKLSESIRRNATVGGTITEHLYNAKTEEYTTVTKEVTEENGFKATEKSSTDPVKANKLTHTTETEYDSPQEIFEYFMENPGMAKTYDTTSSSAVWNYPVNREKLDLLKEVTKEEDGQTYTYRTFNLDYETMGGPDKEQKFILKYNEAGKIVDSCALDPMPDFAYRNDHWVSAPVTTDAQGRAAFNVMALDKGYLLRQGGNSFDDIETAMWKTEATILYAALTDETAAGEAYIFETQDGKIISFDSKTDFDAAVKADMELRAEEAAANQ